MSARIDEVRVSARFSAYPTPHTVHEMATAIGCAASRVRVVLGAMYGRGEIKVGGIRDDGEPIWCHTTDEERARL